MLFYFYCAVITTFNLIVIWLMNVKTINFGKSLFNEIIDSMIEVQYNLSYPNNNVPITIQDRALLTSNNIFC